MRTFIAFDLPEEIKSYLREIQKSINHQAKLSYANDFHLTLKFLGDIPENKIEEIKNILKEIRVKEFNAALSGIGFFPSETYIKVIWIGLSPEKEIYELQQKIDSKLADLFRKDDRFKPHLTLARVKFIKDKIKFIRELKKIKIDRKEFNVSDFKLIKSTLTPEGPVYEDLAVFG